MTFIQHASDLGNVDWRGSPASRDISLTKSFGESPLQNYQYAALPTPTSIRLIEWPRDLVQTTDLRFHLRTVDLAVHDRPPYTALSYTWGADSGLEADDVEKLNDLLTNTIVCDGQYLRVTENAFVALSELRWRGRAHLFWVDAVCIDQSNFEERSVQVAQMGDIFAGAERTIVWLGQEDEQARQAHEIVQKFSYVASDWSVLGGIWDSLQDHIKTLLAVHPLPYLQLIPNADLSRETMSLLELFARPWFQRLWIIQEVVLAKHLWVMCGDMMFEWQAMVDIAHDTRLSGDLQIVKDDHLIEKGIHGLSVVRLIAFLRGDSSSLQRVIQSRFGKAAEISAFYTTLGTLIDMFDSSQLSDSRDRVYAPLALAKKICESQDLVILEPNYTQSVEEVFLAAAHCFIRESKSLDVVTMSKTTDRNGSLPSWVPDFRARSAQKPISALTSCDATKNWSQDLLVKTAGHSVLHLPVTGVPFNGVAHVSPDMTKLLNEDDFSVILRFVHDSLECKEAPDDLPDILLKTTTFGNTWVNNPLSLTQPLRELFTMWFTFKVLSAHYQGKLPMHDLEGLIDRDMASGSRGFCSQHRAIKLPQDPSSRATCIICIKTKRDISDLDNTNIELLATDRGALSDLSFYALLRSANIIYAVIRAHRSGIDTFAVLRREWYRAYSFQTAFTPYITDRSLFLTSDGSLGMCPKTSREGDEVWFLIGSRVPVILRPMSNGHYEFVGEAYLNGYMHGKICQEYGIDQLRGITLE